MKKIITFLAISSLLNTTLNAQTEVDALRYSYLLPNGTARSMGLSGSFSSLGGDMSAVSANPAGIATYRRSELMLSPSLNFNAVTSNYLGVKDKNSRSSFLLNNGSIVFAKNSEENKFKTVNFGIGWNNLANWKQNYYYEGASKGTIIEYLRGKSEGTDFNNLDSFYTRPAFDAYLTDLTNPATTNEYVGVIGQEDVVLRSQEVSSKGSMDEMQIVLGANYDDKLYIGASFDVLFASYSQESDYAEKDRDNILAQFNEMTLHEEFKTSGFGVNGKFGIIYLPTNKIRLSAALHTPTVFSFSDTYSTAITSDLFLPQYGGAIKETKSSPTGTYSYKFSTPLRANIGGAYVFGKSGLISAELEWVDYRTAAFNFTGDKVYQREINGIVKNLYTSSVNMKIGGEYAAGVFRLRGGYAYYSKPFAANASAVDASLHNISVGAGFREDNFSLDIAYTHRFAVSEYTPYVIYQNPAPVLVTNNTRQNSIVISAGFRF